MITENLDLFAGSYEDNEPHSLDSRLMSSWYPRRIVEKTSGGGLLDFGLGHGRAVAYMAGYFDRHVVIEGSRIIIERFWERFPDTRLKIIHGFFESVELNEQFDCVSLGFVLEHVDDPVLILRRAKSFLKPSGTLYMAVPNADSLHRRVGYAAGLLKDTHGLSEQDRKLGHKRYYNLKSLRADVKHAGLEERSVEGIFLKPVTTSQLEKLAFSDELLTAFMIVGVDYPELSNAILLEATHATR